MTIDEIITAERDNAEFSKANNYDKSDDYHNQIAELLEELKAFRENKYTEIYIIRGYHKAIDDFVAKLKEHKYTCNFDWEYYDEIAQQLKVGGKE